ncbi:class I SAM-dependent DNA methyltransferase [Chromatium okenii]|uniref:class I SAM-dependent DNA methyltransferase n=1 Tax=Chromatium okenii TaxID=61644 RepID=UPI0018D59C75|nr:class I SAM-dependent DNA methyltransferase [Chromatium okenii]
MRPWVNGMDITRRPSDTWIIDFGIEFNVTESSFYEKPFQHVVKYVKPKREDNNRDGYRKFWWRYGETRPSLRASLAKFTRYICTPRVSKYRLFVWFSTTIVPDSATVAITRADDTTFGILHSRFHEIWSLRMGTSLGATPRYTPSTTFETFPFPIGLTPANTGGAIETLNSGAIIPTVAAEYQSHAKPLRRQHFNSINCVRIG